MKKNKRTRRRRIQYTIRKKVSGSPQRPRLSVYRSNKEIYCQLIDDVNGVTLTAASSKDTDVSECKDKRERARRVGQAIAQKAQAQDISHIVFDRGGYLYHGRVKELAEGAREGGLQF